MPASIADYVAATNSSGSTAVIQVNGGTSSTTSLTGQAFLNVSTSPPVPGSVAELARLVIQPADVFVGGSVNATVRNMTVVHRQRLRGVFTDRTHFRLEPGSAEVVLTLQTQPQGGSLSAPVNIRASNPGPMTGTLDLTQGMFAVDGTVADSSGNSLTLHFGGPIVNRPPDRDGNGIIDVVDSCPGETFGPDRTPPAFTFVPPTVAISSCRSPNIGTAQATDPCGVSVSNDAPPVFPLGTTLVTWTARDGAGNVATAVQQVTAVLDGDVSCCPAGSHMILGTLNNDLLVGTAGPDCILGFGGQDVISGGDGDDVISGGDGNDQISGQGGNDKLYGGTGQDTISGGSGNDLISGGDGDDSLNGDDGDDVISGGQGKDIVHGGIGNDTIFGDADDDQLHGDDGNDRLTGGAGNDSLFGENGNDILLGNDGDDALNGGTGVNSLDGGPGHNTCIDNNVTLPECPVPDGV